MDCDHLTSAEVIEASGTAVPSKQSTFTACRYRRNRQIRRPSHHRRVGVEDPLMRAAQKIAYGHALRRTPGTDFPGMNKAQFAEFIYQKMQRAIADPRGLVLGVSDSDGVPVIYDPEDNVLIVRDTRPRRDRRRHCFQTRSNQGSELCQQEVRFDINRHSQRRISPTTAKPRRPLLDSRRPSVGSVGTPSDTIAVPRQAGGGGGGGSWDDEESASEAVRGPKLHQGTGERMCRQKNSRKQRWRTRHSRTDTSGHDNRRTHVILTAGLSEWIASDE